MSKNKPKKKDFPKDFWNHNLNPITGMPSQTKINQRKLNGIDAVSNYEFFKTVRK